jgi:hypothetical protein
LKVLLTVVHPVHEEKLLPPAVEGAVIEITSLAWPVTVKLVLAVYDRGVIGLGLTVIETPLEGLVELTVSV